VIPRAIVIFGIALFALVSAVTANAQVRGTIFGPGVRQYPIAVAQLQNLDRGADAAGLSATFSDVLSRDLELSGFFRLVPRDSHIDDPDTSGQNAENINFDNWSVLGALALVKGSLETAPSGVTIEARLFDVSQRTRLMGRRYQGGRGDVRRMAHRFADEILRQFTGERGPFDSQIVFLSTREGRFKDAYVTSIDGGDVRRVTNADTINLSPTWAPDGRSIVLTSFRSGNPDLYSVDLDGAKWRRLSNLRGLNLGGRWSPDGSTIAVTIEYDGNSEIALLNPDGALARRLTDHWAIDVSPSWSPDGRQIAFCSSRTGSPQIYIMSSQGGTPRRVTFDGNYNTSPSWSPKGDLLAYASRINGRFQLFTVKTDGSDTAQITASRGDNEDPSWSPDGRYIVFSSSRTGSPRLYMSDRSGTTQLELTGGKGGDTSPSWSRWRD
jgi:TolB protein